MLRSKRKKTCGANFADQTRSRAVGYKKRTNKIINRHGWKANTKRNQNNVSE